MVVLLWIAASRYQPLSIKPDMATWKDRGSPAQVTVSLSTTLSSRGPFGVDVVALHPTVYADPPLKVSPLQPCFEYFKRQHWCPQDKNGYFTGNKFRSFLLDGGTTIPLIWRYSFSCRPLAGSSGSLAGPVEVLVQYRFGFFTHDVLLELPDSSTVLFGITGPCAPVG